jgi:hypothetical protein
MNTTQQLLFAALSGALLGATACASTPPNAESPQAMSAERDAPMAASDKHGCKGQNECKGRGGCKTEHNACKGQNECKGRGGCSTLGPKPQATDTADGAMDGAKHACKGQNECKGHGGCKTEHNACKGQNECKGRGGCHAA